MSPHFTGFRLWAFVSCIFSPIVAFIVPAQFDSMGWLWLLVPPAIVLTVLTAVCFAFIFTAPKLTSVSFRISRFSRATVVLLAAGFGYLTGWFYYCASENGCSPKLGFLPGVAMLALAWFLLYRFRYDVSAA